MTSAEMNLYIYIYTGAYICHKWHLMATAALFCKPKYIWQMLPMFRRFHHMTGRVFGMVLSMFSRFHRITGSV